MKTETWYIKSEPRSSKWTWVLYSGNHKPVAESKKLFDDRHTAESFAMAITDNQFEVRRYQGGASQTRIKPEAING